MKHPTEEQIDAALAYVDACNREPYNPRGCNDAAEILFELMDWTSLPADVVATTVLAAAVRWLRDGRDKTRECLK